LGPEADSRSYFPSGTTSPGTHVGISILFVMVGGWGVRLGISETAQVICQALYTRRVLPVASAPVLVAASEPASEFRLEVQRPQPLVSLVQSWTRSSYSKERYS
jgi:hypothetical protein